MFLFSFCICLCPIHWSHVLSREWRYVVGAAPTGNAPTTLGQGNAHAPAPALKPECIYFKWQYHYICDECVKRISAMCEWSQCLTANYECFQCETERYLRTDCVCCATIMTISHCTCLPSHVCACNLFQNAVYCKYIHRATWKTTGNVFKKSYHYGE